MGAAAARRRLAALLRARERHPHVVDHGVLHRHLQAAALPGLLPLIERAQDADRHQHAGAGVAKRRARLDRRPVGLAGDAERATGGLRDHVESEVFFVWAAGPETLDLAVDDAGVDLLDLVIAEAQPLDRAGRHVLDRHVSLCQQRLDDFEPARRFEVEGDRLLVGVELVEIPGVVVGLTGLQPPAGVAAARVFDLDHLGAEPRQGLGAGGSRLELGEVDDLDTFETIQFHARYRHRLHSSQKRSDPHYKSAADCAKARSRRELPISSCGRSKPCRSFVKSRNFTAR